MTQTGQAHRETAPLILTLALAAPDQARFDRLREAHFPPERNFLQSHVTLFHHLPGEDLVSIRANLASCAMTPFPVAVTGLRSLGRGVAFSLASPELTRLRAMFAQHWHADLGPQDRQSFRPHVTVQNKVTPEAAKALLAELTASFSPFDIQAVGLLLWHYRGGPWELEAEYPFKDRPEARPIPRHRSPSSDPS